MNNNRIDVNNEDFSPMDYPAYEIHNFLNSNKNSVKDREKFLRSMKPEILAKLINNIIEIKNYKNILDVIPDDVKVELFKENGMLIKYFKNPNDEMKIAALGENGLALQHLNSKSVTKEMLMIAVENNPYSVQFMKYPFYKLDDDIVMTAIKGNTHVISLDILQNYNLTEEMKKQALNSGFLATIFLKDLTEEMKEIAIRKNPYQVKYLTKLSDKLKKLSLELEPRVIKEFILPASLEMQMLATKDDPTIMFYIKNIDNDLMEVLINKIKKSSDNVKKDFSKKFEEILKEEYFGFIGDKMPLKLQLFVTELDPAIVNKMKFPDPDVKKLAVKLNPSLLIDILEYQNKTTDKEDIEEVKEIEELNKELTSIAKKTINSNKAQKDLFEEKLTRLINRNSSSSKNYIEDLKLLVNTTTTTNNFSIRPKM